ncbi:MAG: NAD(P)H-dependent oxidoreductase [Actinomycetota bacterium]|nr:NAD(P)H-dependent oxidoreductase [Actinomycetota bacterium]
MTAVHSPLATALGAVAVTGNPRPDSRTAAIAGHVARRLAVALAGEDATVVEFDLADPALSHDAARSLLRGAGLAVIASPTYKATYSGLLKGFLDGLPNDALAGIVAVPLMVAGDRGHALAVELHLRPLLAELGAFTPPRGLFFEERSLLEPDAVLDPWLERSLPVLAALVAVAGPR